MSSLSSLNERGRFLLVRNNLSVVRLVCRGRGCWRWRASSRRRRRRSTLDTRRRIRHTKTQFNRLFQRRQFPSTLAVSWNYIPNLFLRLMKKIFQQWHKVLGYSHMTFAPVINRSRILPPRLDPKLRPNNEAPVIHWCFGNLPMHRCFTEALAFNRCKLFQIDRSCSEYWYILPGKHPHLYNTNEM